jgi:L-threonylcarbamoyladenylate synthase
MIKEKEIIEIIKAGGVGILPTDTIYGLVGSAQNPETVKRIKKLKSRSSTKPFIILISGLQDLEKFNINLKEKDQKILGKIWPSSISVALSSKYSFRWPNNKSLEKIIRQTGPLIAPSGNPEGLKPAETISEAKNYFGQNVDFYLSAGKRLASQSSTLIRLKNGKIDILRSGKDYDKLRSIQTK